MKREQRLSELKQLFDQSIKGKQYIRIWAAIDGQPVIESEEETTLENTVNILQHDKGMPADFYKAFDLEKLSKDPTARRLIDGGNRFTNGDISEQTKQGGRDEKE